jgi:GAF domain-containing protein
MNDQSNGSATTRGPDGHAVAAGGSASTSLQFDAVAGIVHELARGDAIDSTLEHLLRALAGAVSAVSSAILVPDADGALRIAASLGIDNQARAGLTAAVRNPGHPVTRTFDSGLGAYDVLPTAPGGPALRTHLPLIVGRGESTEVLGVLALAHDRAIDASLRPLAETCADLAAIAVEQARDAHR